MSDKVITTEGDFSLHETLVVNGSIDVRRTHPGLYRMVMATAVISLALGVNFLVYTPTFFVYDQSYKLWAVIFFACGLSKVVFLNFYRSLRLTRLAMSFSIAYISFFAVGTMQPAIEGQGSLQLPILYAGLVSLQLFLLLEPFINPWTARRDG